MDIWTKAGTFSSSALARLGNKLLATSTSTESKSAQRSPVAPMMSPTGPSASPGEQFSASLIDFFQFPLQQPRQPSSRRSSANQHYGYPTTFRRSSLLVSRSRSSRSYFLSWSNQKKKSQWNHCFFSNQSPLSSRVLYTESILVCPRRYRLGLHPPPSASTSSSVQPPDVPIPANVLALLQATAQAEPSEAAREQQKKEEEERMIQRVLAEAQGG